MLEKRKEDIVELLIVWFLEKSWRLGGEYEER